MSVKTAYNLRHELPDGVRHRYVTNIRHNGTVRLPCKSLYRAIDHALTWSGTPEGSEFWGTIYSSVGENKKLPPMSTDMTPDEYLSLI